MRAWRSAVVDNVKALRDRIKQWGDALSLVRGWHSLDKIASVITELESLEKVTREEADDVPQSMSGELTEPLSELKRHLGELENPWGNQMPPTPPPWLIPFWNNPGTGASAPADPRPQYFRLQIEALIRLIESRYHRLLARTLDHYCKIAQKPDLCVDRDLAGGDRDRLFPIAECFEERWYFGPSKARRSR